MKLLLTICIHLLAIVVGHAQTKQFKVLTSFPIAGNGDWDDITLHQDRLYVTHNSQVNIIDAKTGDSIGVIKNLWQLNIQTFVLITQRPDWT